jgi:hypothetical protein
MLQIRIACESVLGRRLLKLLIVKTSECRVIPRSVRTKASCAALASIDSPNPALSASSR